MECKALITVINSNPELKSGPIEVEIMTKNDKNTSKLKKD